MRVSLVYSLIEITIERVDSSEQGPSFLSLNLLFTAPDAAESLLQCRSHALSSGVAASDTRSLGIKCLGWDDSRGFSVTNALAVVTAGGHLGSRVSEPLVVFQSFLDGVGWFTLSFQVIWMVLLRKVSDDQDRVG